MSYLSLKVIEHVCVHCGVCVCVCWFGFWDGCFSCSQFLGRDRTSMFGMLDPLSCYVPIGF